MLVLLDLSAAFDIVDHGILLERLQVTFGVDNSALAWFRSYLAGQRQHVRCGGKRSALSDVICGVPQRSVLGPISLFSTSLIWRRLSQTMACRYTSMLTTARYTAPVSLMLLRRCRIQCHNVSTASLSGCALESPPTQCR